MSMLKDAGIWLYKKARNPIRGVLTTTGLIELTFMGAAKGALFGGVLGGLLGSIFPGAGHILGVIFGVILGIGLACGLGIYLKKWMDKIDAEIAQEDKEFELEIIKAEKNNLENEISLRAKLKELREQWAGEHNPRTRNAFTNNVRDLSKKIASLLEQRAKSLDIKTLYERISTHVSRTLTPRDQKEDEIEFVDRRTIQANDSVVMKPLPSTPRNDSASEQETPISSNFFTATKIVGAVGTIFTCAYYLGTVGAFLCAPIPLLIPFGYAFGALTGAALGILFVYVFRDSLETIKEATESKNHQADPEWLSELKALENEIDETQSALLELKSTVATQGEIIRQRMGVRYTQTTNKDEPGRSNQTKSLANPEDTDEITPLLLMSGRAGSTSKQNDTNSDGTNSSPNENKSPKGFWGWTFHYIKQAANYALLTLGGTVAIGTIATCTFYGALMGFTVGTPVPIFGPIGMCIVGGLVGFIVGSVCAYMGVKGGITVIKGLTNNDKKTRLQEELTQVIEKLDKTYEELERIEKDLDDQIALLEQHTPRTTPRDSTNAAHEDLQKIELHDAPPLKPAATDSTTDASNYSSINSVTSKIKSAWETTKSIFFKCVGGAAGLAIVGLCAYQGVMLGLSLGTVIPGAGNIIGAVTGGLIGIAVGLILVHAAAKGVEVAGRLVYGDKVSDNVKIVNAKIERNKNKMKNIKEKQKLFDEVYTQAFDEQSRVKYSEYEGQRKDPKDEAEKRRRSEATQNSGSTPHGHEQMEAIDLSSSDAPPRTTAAPQLTDTRPPVDSKALALKPPAAKALAQTSTAPQDSRKQSDSAPALTSPHAAFYPLADSAGSGSAVPPATAKAPPNRPPPKPSAELATGKLPVTPLVNDANSAQTSAQLPAVAAPPLAGATIPPPIAATEKLPALKGAAGKLPPQLLAAIAKGNLPPLPDPLPQPPPRQLNDTSSQRGVNP